MDQVRILIVKIAAIGDVVMALPLLTHIRSQYPNSHITWLGGLQMKPLLEATGLVDQILCIDEKALFRGTFVSRLWAVLKVWKILFGQFFDLCLIAHPDPRYRWLTFPIRCKEKRFWTRIKGRMNPVPGRYHADEYLRLFTGKEGPAEIPVVFPKMHLKEFRIDSEKPLVAIAPGGAKNALADDALRRWPIEHYVALMQTLSAYPIQLVVTGSSSDQWVMEHLQGIPYLNLIGKLALLDLIALFKECKLLITHDSGPLHLAKLVNCPTIALFGPTNPSEKVGREEKIKVFWGGEHLACRPCYDGKGYAPCKKNECLRNIKPEVVVEEILSLLLLPAYKM